MSSAAPPIARLTAWWTVAVLSFVAILGWSDRAPISAIAEPVKREFGLSGAQISYVKAGAEMGLGTLDLGSIKIEEIAV